MTSIALVPYEGKLGMDVKRFWCCLLLVQTVFIPHILSGILRFSPDGQTSVMAILDRFLQTIAGKEENLLNGESTVLHFILGIRLESGSSKPRLPNRNREPWVEKLKKLEFGGKNTNVHSSICIPCSVLRIIEGNSDCFKEVTIIGGKWTINAYVFYADKVHFSRKYGKKKNWKIVSFTRNEY